MSRKLTYYPIEDILTAGEFPVKYDYDDIDKISQYLKPENSIIFFTSKIFQDKTNKTEPW